MSAVAHATLGARELLRLYNAARIFKPGAGSRSMAIRILFIIAAIALCGCTPPRMFKELGIYTGPVLPTCSGPVTGEAYQSGRCMTGADHDIARKKARHMLEEEATSKQD